MADQSQSAKQPKVADQSSDQLHITHSIEPPTIEDVVKVANQAIKQAVKVQRQRRHHCRSCGLATCRHFQRVDSDTDENFDITDDPKYVDADGKGRLGKR